MAIELLLNKDQNGSLTYGIPSITEHNGGMAFECVLGAKHEATLTVPNGVNLAIFAYSSPTVRVANGTTPLEAPTASFSQTNVELTPAVREVNPGDTLRFRSEINAHVSVSFWHVGTGRR